MRNHVVELKEKPLEELHVSMNNILIRSAQGLRLAEKRVVSACLAKLDSVRLDSYGRYKFKLSADEYAETFGLDASTAYVQMREAGDFLMKRIARVVEETPRGKRERKWVWVSGVTYHHGEGWIEVGFSPEMTPHLIVLRGTFTSYKLKQAAAFRSIYAWRLFEMLMQFKNTGLCRISVEEFCHAMEAPESCVKNFGELKRRVILPAIKEITSKDNWIIEWKGTKPGGKKIQGLEFSFKKDPQGRLI